MIKKISNTDNLIYSNMVSSIFDISTNKNNKIHNELFDYALLSYIKANLPYTTIDELKSDYIIIEKTTNNFLLPSKVILKMNKKPFTILNVDLKDYWPKYQFVGNLDDIKIINKDEDFGENKLINIDYVRGKATLKNTFTDISFEVPLNNINANTKVSEEMSLSDTFTNLLKNK